MRFIGLLLLMLSLGLTSASCTKRDPQTKKKNPTDEKDTSQEEDDDSELEEKSSRAGEPEEERAPDYKDGTQGEGGVEPDSQTTQSAEYVKLINGWSGTEDIHPSGLKFYTRSFEQAPAANTTPGGAGSGTFTALVAEFRAQRCLTCHTQGGQQSVKPLDDHSRMVIGGTPQSWVTGASATIRATAGGAVPIMPPLNQLAPAQRNTNAGKIDQLIQAWRTAGYPAQ